MEAKIQVEFLGIRGSSVAYGMDKRKYGTNTSCIYMELNNRHIVLDGGTGIKYLDNYLLKEKALKKGNEKIVVDIFISHVHFDHIIGIAGLKILFSEDFKVNFYGEARDGKTIKEQLQELFKPPFWPVGVDMFSADVDYITIKVGGNIVVDETILVETMRGNHPDVCTIFKISYKGKKIVYALDYEYEIESFQSLAKFTKDCDLLVYDGALTDEEYELRKGWGHSTVEKGALIGRKSGVKQVALCHVDVDKTDEEVDRLQERIKQEKDNICFIPMEGERILI